MGEGGRGGRLPHDVSRLDVHVDHTSGLARGGEGWGGEGGRITTVRVRVIGRVILPIPGLVLVFA